MSNVWCVRAEFGTYAQQFVTGGYAGIGFIQNIDLSSIVSRDELYPIYRSAHPEEQSNVVIGQQVGQIARFLLEIKADDYVLTPAADTEWLHYGKVSSEKTYYVAKPDDGAPYQHRRKITWAKNLLRRADFSVPFQNTIRSSLTVFSVSQAEEFLRHIGHATSTPAAQAKAHDPYESVLTQLMELDPREFEILITHLLTALGFEGSEHTGKSGDGGVDATGELNVSGLAKVKLYVQAKRYKPDARITARVVRELRQSIPSTGQGAFITTADYQAAAHDIATEPGFPRIGLVNGRQLVDLLIEHWNSIPVAFQEKLGLKLGLIKI